MIRFTPRDEPPDFDVLVRQPGRKWMSDHPEKAPRDFWSAIRPQLADAFRNLCGYSAMHDLCGTVDHYLSKQNHPGLAYEWTNYRYCSQWINSSKGCLDERVLDPYEVEDGWFEVLLPSLQLVPSAALPSELRERAEFTLEHLHLRDDERVIRQRQAWYGYYLKGGFPLEMLDVFAPLIARAIRGQQAEGECGGDERVAGDDR